MKNDKTEQPAQQSHCNDCGGFDPECPLAQPAQGCEFCSHPLYAGTKCKNCGREQPAQQQEIEYCTDYHCAGDCGQPHNQEEMREFLAAQQQEPDTKDVVINNMGRPFTVKAYTSPQPAQQQEPAAIKWTLDGDKTCRYNNWLGETPFGRILITWKGWKQHHDADVDAFPGDFYAHGSPDEVKEMCEAEFAKRSGYTSPPASKPWVGLTDEEINAEWVLTPQNDKAEGLWFGRRIEAKLREKNAAPCKPLTDEQIDRLYASCKYGSVLELARAIEAAHGIKGDA